MPKTTARPNQNPAPVQGPPAEEFWEEYNRCLEFPLSIMTTVWLGTNRLEQKAATKILDRLLEMVGSFK